MAVVRLRIHELLEERYADERPTMEEMARSLNMTPKTVSNWIRNRVDKPELQSIAKWADYFGVHPGELFHYEPSENGSPQ